MDTLSRTLINQSAVDRWNAMAPALLKQAQQHGCKTPSDIPDELARVEPDGTLTLYVVMPDGAELTMRIEPQEWAWHGPRSQTQ